jgi:tetratricopeptide (TPR) repeat protein
MLGLLIAICCALAYPADANREVTGFDREITRGNFAAVEGPLEAFAAAHSSSAEAWYQLGYVYYRLHKIWPSVKALSKSLSINSRQPDAHRILGLDFTILDRLDLAEDELRRAVALDPASADNRYHLGRICFERGNSSEAVQHFEKALRLSRGDVKTLHNLALAYEAINQVDRARDCFQQAIVQDEKAVAHSEWAYINYGGFLNRRYEYDAALAILRKGEGISPNAELQFELAKTYRGLERWADAVGALEKAVQLSPRESQYFYVLSLIYRKLGKENESREALARYEELRRSEQRPAATPR